MPSAQTARSSWDRRLPLSTATWHPLGCGGGGGEEEVDDLRSPSPSPPLPAEGARSVQRGQCADWNTAGAPPSRYTARQVADSPAHLRGGATRRRRRRRRRGGAWCRVLFDRFDWWVVMLMLGGCGWKRVAKLAACI